MLALLTLPVVMSLVLMSTEESGNVDGGAGYTDTIGLPVWAYTAGGALIFLTLLAVTFGFRSTGKRH